MLKLQSSSAPHQAQRALSPFDQAFILGLEICPSGPKTKHGLVSTDLYLTLAMPQLQAVEPWVP